MMNEEKTKKAVGTGCVHPVHFVHSVHCRTPWGEGAVNVNSGLYRFGNLPTMETAMHRAPAPGGMRGGKSK